MPNKVFSNGIGQRSPDIEEMKDASLTVHTVGRGEKAHKKHNSSNKVPLMFLEGY